MCKRWFSNACCCEWCCCVWCRCYQMAWCMGFECRDVHNWMVCALGTVGSINKLPSAQITCTWRKDRVSPVDTPGSLVHVDRSASASLSCVRRPLIKCRLTQNIRNNNIITIIVHVHFYMYNHYHSIIIITIHHHHHCTIIPM